MLRFTRKNRRTRERRGGDRELWSTLWTPAWLVLPHFHSFSTCKICKGSLLCIPSSPIQSVWCLWETSKPQEIPEKLPQLDTLALCWGSPGSPVFFCLFCLRKEKVFGNLPKSKGERSLAHFFLFIGLMAAVQGFIELFCSAVGAA